MRSFRKIRIPAAVVLLLLAVNLGLNYILIPASYVNFMIHKGVSQAHDTVFLGTSHGLNGISPKIVEEQSGEKAINLCMGGEYPRDAYYLLKMVCEKSVPKTVVYELDFGYWCTPEGQRGDFNRIYYEMPWSLVKAEYLLAKEWKLDFRAVLFPWFYYRGQFRDVKKIVSLKQSREYRDHEEAVFQLDGYGYMDGFMRNRPIPGEKPEDNLVLWNEEERNEDSFRYFEKMADFCKKKGIRLVVLTTPVPGAALDKYGENFQEADTFFTEYLEQMGIDYWNYNRPGTRIENFDDSLDAFTDYEGRMSAGQAEAFSVQLVEDIL